jgi:hypothetical protein
MKFLVFGAAIFVAGLAVACGGEEEAIPTGLATVQTTPTPPLLTPTLAATPCTRDDPACMPDESEVPFQGLTAEEVQEAKDVAANDATLTRILNGAPHQIPNGGRSEVHGEVFVTLTVGLDAPLSIDADLPYADMGYRGDEGNGTQIELPPPYYIEGTGHMTIEALSLVVTLDLTRGKVIAILPLPFSASAPTPG